MEQPAKRHVLAELSRSEEPCLERTKLGVEVHCVKNKGTRSGEHLRATAPTKEARAGNQEILRNTVEAQAAVRGFADSKREVKGTATKKVVELRAAVDGCGE
ncbi:hypothetical protein ERJ75_000493200 [Trypanosoma vivax]|nr:hypothetical protein ERJ75_000493200 [Trypanosoma vivax]